MTSQQSRALAHHCRFAFETAQAMDAVNAPREYLHGQRVEKVCEQLDTMTLFNDRLSAEHKALGREYRQVCEQIATLTAERDEARAWVRTFAARQNDESRYCPQCGQACRIILDARAKLDREL